MLRREKKTRKQNFCNLEVSGSPVQRFFLLLDAALQLCGPDGQHLGLLHQLLVGRVRLYAHDNSALLRINLGVQLGVSVKIVMFNFC